VIALDIAWGVVTGLAAWLPSRVLGRGRPWGALLDLLAVALAMFVYWEILDAHLPHFTSRVLAFTLAGLVVAVFGTLDQRRRSRSTPAA